MKYPSSIHTKTTDNYNVAARINHNFFLLCQCSTLWHILACEFSQCMENAGKVGETAKASMKHMRLLSVAFSIQIQYVSLNILAHTYFIEKFSKIYWTWCNFRSFRPCTGCAVLIQFTSLNDSISNQFKQFSIISHAVDH